MRGMKAGLKNWPKSVEKKSVENRRCRSNIIFMNKFVLTERAIGHVLGITKYLLILIVSLSNTVAVLADDTEVVRQRLHITTGYSQAPYFISEDSGIVSEILRAVFADSQYEYELEFLANSVALQKFNNKEVDGITLVRPSMVVESFLSEPYVIFQNSAIHLKKNSYKIKKIPDLANYRVLAFSNAVKYLPGEFEEMAQANPRYRTISKQMDQVAELFHESTDVIVADKAIYQFYHKKLIYQSKLDKRYAEEVTFNDVFPPSAYSSAFHSEEVRDFFNRGLTRIENNGTLVKIYRKYTELMTSY